MANGAAEGWSHDHPRSALSALLLAQIGASRRTFRGQGGCRWGGAKTRLPDADESPPANYVRNFKDCRRSEQKAARVASCYGCPSAREAVIAISLSLPLADRPATRFFYIRDPHFR